MRHSVTTEDRLRTGVRRASSLGSQTYAKLRTDIFRCALAPGQTVSESQLATRYGVSKAPVRWALAALSREQLVFARSRQGYVIAPVTIESVRDLFDLRLLLEPAVARLAAGRVDAARLNDIHDKISAASRPGANARERRWIELNIQFHVEIARACGNERLARINEEILEESQRILFILTAELERARPMAEDHRDMIAALGRADGDAAERAAREHIENSRRTIMDALLNSAGVQRANIVELGVGSAPRNS